MCSVKGADCSWWQFSRYVLPSVGAMLLFSLYTVVDGIFVVWGAGELALTSITIAMPFLSCLSGISVLISMGTATLVAFARGRGDGKEANALFSQTVAVIVVLSIAITGTVACLAEPLARLLGAGPLTLENTTAYLRIISLFSICLILSYCLEVMVKVDDRPQMAIIGVSTSVVTNIGLDYLFVLVFDWGVKGAAWATGLAQLVSLVLFLCYFYSKKSHLKIGKFPWRPKIFLRTIPLGVADCSVEVIMAWLTLLYNHLLRNLFGESSMTIYAVIAYFNLLVFMMMQGVAQGMMHLVSLQLGKGKVTSATGYFSMSMICNLTLGMLILVLCQLMPELFVGMLLKADSPMFQQTLHAVQQFSLSFPLVGLNIATAGYFTARELPIPSISLALGRGFFFAPIALLLCAFFAEGQFIWLAAVLGEAACLLVSFYFLLRWKDAKQTELKTVC